MFLHKGNICSKSWKHTLTQLKEVSTFGHSVGRLKIPKVHTNTISRLPVAVCKYKQYKISSCSHKVVGLEKCSCPYSKRSLSTSSIEFGVNVRLQTISSRLDAEILVREMNEDERTRLRTALDDLKQEYQLEEGKMDDDNPNVRQLLLLGFSNSVPFVGFGFLDNAIMIAAGEYIDSTVGVALGISTMAAAAIGNMISDIAGICLAGYVEVLAARLGIEEPHLTANQLMMKSSRVACYGGRAAGIVVGCIIGMFPLLLIKTDESKSKPD